MQIPLISSLDICETGYTYMMNSALPAYPILICHNDPVLANRCRNTTQRLGYDSETTQLPVVQTYRPPLPTPTGSSRLADMFGCAHPSPEDCPICNVTRYVDVLTRSDPFLATEKLKARYEAVRNYPVESVREAKDIYTYFGAYNEWMRIIAVSRFFATQYKVIQERLVAIRLRYMQTQRREYENRYRSMRPDQSGESSDPKRTRSSSKTSPSHVILTDKEYCSWIYTPPPNLRNRRGMISLHYVYATAPTTTEVARYLELVFNPPPSLSQAFMNAVRRSISQGQLAKPGKPSRAGIKVVQRRSTAGALRVSKKPSQRTLALFQGANFRYATERSDVPLGSDDPRKARAKRLEKQPEIKDKFQEGWPMMIFVSDSPTLEKRVDYRITADDRYVNVFHLETPIVAPAPVGGEWGDFAEESESSSLQEET